MEIVIGELIDLMFFFKLKIKDNIVLWVEGIMLFLQLGSGVVGGSLEWQSFLINIVCFIEVWGVIGLGIKVYDYMDGVYNCYGVYIVVFRVDGMEVFCSVVDCFLQDENWMINFWICG